MHVSFIISVLALWPIFGQIVEGEKSWKTYAAGSFAKRQPEERNPGLCPPEGRLRCVHSTYFRHQRISLKERHITAIPVKGYPVSDTRKSASPSKDSPARVFWCLIRVLSFSAVLVQFGAESAAHMMLTPGQPRPSLFRSPRKVFLRKGEAAAAALIYATSWAQQVLKMNSSILQ